MSYAARNASRKPRRDTAVLQCGFVDAASDPMATLLQTNMHRTYSAAEIEDNKYLGRKVLYLIFIH